MPLAQRDRRSIAHRRLLVAAIVVLVGVLASLSLVHCPKGVAALTHTAVSSGVLAQNSPLTEQPGGTCASAEVVVSEDVKHVARPLLAAPALITSFRDPPIHDGMYGAYPPGNVNPLAALDGRSLLYRISVIRR